MRHVVPVSIDQLPTLAQIEISLSAELRPAIAAARASIEEAYANFELAIPHNLHALRPVELPTATKKILKDIFKRRMGEFGTLWEALNQHFEDDHVSTCPYCNFGEQWEYDHYLPKGVFPEYSLFSSNLVPICKGCNSKKLTSYQKDDERLFTHVFFELEDADGLLDLTIHYEPKLTVSYSLVRPATISAASFEVLERHFIKLNLGRRYAKQASTTIARLVRAFRAPKNLDLGPARLRSRLRQMADDRVIQCPENHWEAVLLKRLAASPDFTNYIFS